MSRDQAKACIEKFKADEAFRSRVLATADVAARIALINAEGFACNLQEIEAASAELADGDLDAVSGGTGVKATPGIMAFGGTPTLMTATAATRGVGG